MNYERVNYQSLKYQRLKPIFCKTIGIRKFKFVPKTQFLQGFKRVQVCKVKPRAKVWRNLNSGPVLLVDVFVIMCGIIINDPIVNNVLKYTF